MLFVNLISMKFKIEETNGSHRKNKKLRNKENIYLKEMLLTKQIIMRYIRF